MVLAGVFFLITVVKFGNPVILDEIVTPPNGWLDAIFGISTYSWQSKWGYPLMVPVFVAGLFAIRWKPYAGKWPWLLLLPALWLGWEFVSATASISPKLTRLTLAHFSACVAFFYLGLFALRGARNPWPVWAGLGLALCWVLHIAMAQHFGGLEATRKMVMEGKLYLSPELLHDPAYRARLQSDRIEGSFMYPNALAAGLLLLLPVTLVFLWQATPKVRAGIRALFVTILGGCGLACLYWSGSKAAWLFMVLLGVIALGHSSLRKAWKRTLIYGLLALGFTGFTIKYVDSATHGRRSMEARLVYWQAALRNFRQHPILGSGPGTFGPAYDKIRPPNAEFARLTHNDYLEQASDSGIIGLLTYTGLIVGSIAYLYRYRLLKKGRFYTIRFAVWLGLLGLSLHSSMEFNLYYPALAWPAFFLLGWLWGLEEE
jgi:O-antigen ligase